MGRLAFYAPLKSPRHQVPSGDREIARGIFTALSMNSLGLSVELASELRCYDGAGDALLQKKIQAMAEAEVARLLASPRVRDLRAWVTYHNYYKAPDLIGSAVSRELKLSLIHI